MVTHSVASGAADHSVSSAIFHFRHTKFNQSWLFVIMRLLATLLIGLEAARRSERISERSLRWLDHKKCMGKENIKRSDSNGEGTLNIY